MSGRGNVSGDAVARSIVAGVATGLRSQSTFPVLARAAREGRFAVKAAPPIGWLRSPLVGRLTTLAAAGELVVDKLPFTPSRIDPQPLAGRLGFGALSGGIVANTAGRPWFAGALLGAVGALVGSFTGYWVRKRIVEQTGLPDLVVALGEDATAIGLSHAIVPR